MTTKVLGKIYNWEEWENEDFVYVDMFATDFDSEKGFQDNDLIIKRLSDQTYWKIEYTDFGQGQDNFTTEELDMIQVYPVKVETTHWSTEKK